MPSNMVTGGGKRPPAAPNTPYAISLKATSPLFPQQQFLRKTWAPRAGYSKEYESWLDDIKRFLKMLGMKLDDLQTPCPQLSAIPQTPTYTPYGAIVGHR